MTVKRGHRPLDEVPVILEQADAARRIAQQATGRAVELHDIAEVLEPSRRCMVRTYAADLFGGKQGDRDIVEPLQQFQTDEDACFVVRTDACALFEFIDRKSTRLNS